MTMAKNYLKQWSLENEGFSSCVALRICFLTHLVPVHGAGTVKAQKMSATSLEAPDTLKVSKTFFV